MKKCVPHGKDIHPSPSSAIRSALKSSRKRGTPLRYYYDHQCQCFHLTKKPKADWGNAA